jgi:hypothetical protein
MRAQSLEECRVHLTQHCTVGLENCLKTRNANTNASNPNKPYNARNYSNHEEKPRTYAEKPNFSRANNSGNNYQRPPYVKQEPQYGNQYKKTTFEKREPQYGNQYQKPVFVKREYPEKPSQPLNVVDYNNYQDASEFECNSNLSNSAETVVSALEKLHVRLDAIENHFLGQRPASDTSTS